MADQYQVEIDELQQWLKKVSEDEQRLTNQVEELKDKILRLRARRVVYTKMGNHEETEKIDSQIESLQTQLNTKGKTNSPKLTQYRQLITQIELELQRLQRKPS